MFSYRIEGNQKIRENPKRRTKLEEVDLGGYCVYITAWSVLRLCIYSDIKII